jgi:hypothetical protein
MNVQNSGLLVGLILAGMLFNSPAARASLTMNTIPQAIYQIGDGSTAVSLGHVVNARTNMNRLVAGGSFNASCASTYTGSIPGERTLTSDLIASMNVLSVTIPEWLPAVRNMPGFENVPVGSVLSCTYAWTSRAQEATYTVGVPGFGITIGGQEIRDGGSIGFYMYKTSGSGDEPSRGCLG